MKKIALLVALLTIAFVSSAFAAVSTQGQTISASGEIISKLSGNVIADVETSAATYAVATKATKGTKIYATAADDTIYAKADTAGDALVDGDLTVNDSSFADDGGWTDL